MIFLSKWVICRLHVYLPGCNGKMLTLAGAPLLHHHGCPVLSRITAPRPLQGAPPVRSVVKDSYVSSESWEKWRREFANWLVQLLFPGSFNWWDR